jgi:serine protease Do
LTNRHVIRNSATRGGRFNNIKINLADGRQIHPRKVWEDPPTDIAVMKISAPGLFAAPVGDSDQMEIGDFVLAVGSPFGLSHSVTYGIISAKGRRNLNLTDSGSALHRFIQQEFIQTDAAINPGNSGGPLINLRGEVIGINTAIASNSGGNEGIGFAIPVNMVMFVARQLIEKGDVTRGFLGVTLHDDLSPAVAARFGLPRPRGARVKAIIPKSPAAKAELEADDVILEFNDRPVEDSAHLINLVSPTKVGDTVRLVIFRDGKTLVAELTVVNRNQFWPDKETETGD